MAGVELRLPTRWTDFDALGHLTHVAYPVFFDEARDAYMRARVGDFEAWPYVIAHIEIDFRREIPFPTHEVVVRTRVEAVGRTSVTFVQELDDAATARAVIVAFDRETRAARAIDEGSRARILAAA